MVKRVLSLLHLSLVEKNQKALGAFRGSREEWVRYSLSKPFHFLGWGGRELVWTPRGDFDDLVFGLIQGKRPHLYHEPPSIGGEETYDDFWQGAFVFLDPRHHDDGQKIAIENDVLGKPRALAKALFDSINERFDAPYSAIAETIFDESDFWKFSEQSGGILKYVKFEFVIPNMWGPQNDLEKDLKDTGKQTGGDRVDVTFRGKDGIRTENEKIKTAVGYVSRGAGVVKAKNLRNVAFSSSKRPTLSSVGDQELDTTSPDTIGNIGRRLLGRE